MADPITYDQMRDLLREQASYIKGSGGGAGGGGGSSASSIGSGTAVNAINSTVNGLGALATGTATAKDVIGATSAVMSKFSSVGEIAGNAFGKFGGSIIDVNNTLKETGKYGINFGQNLGEANKSIIQAQYTMPEFQEAIRANGKSLAGMAGGQNDSAKTFLALAREMQGTTVAQDLKAAGMSSVELNDALLLTSRNSFRVNMADAEARAQATGAALAMANEMNKVADLTGKSRKQQEDEIRRIQERADVEAAVLLKQKTDPNFGKNMDAATQAMSRFGPKVQELLAEEATGGARSKDAIATKAALGPAAEAIAQYGKALETGNPQLIAEAKKKAEIAVSERVNSEEFLKTAKVTQGNVLNMGSLVHDSFTYQKNIASEQEELAKQGKEATKEAAEASLAAKAEARARGEKIDDKTGKPVKDDGAVLGRTINQVENLGKVIGGTMANGFNSLNTQLGKTVNTSFPEFEAKLRSFSKDPSALGAEVQKGVNEAASAAGVKTVKPEVSKKASDLVKAGPGVPKQAAGSKDVFGDWFAKDWGAGGLSELHGKEAVVPEGKVGEFMRDMTKSMPKPEDVNAKLNEAMASMTKSMPDLDKLSNNLGNSFSSMFSGFDKSVDKKDLALDLPPPAEMAKQIREAFSGMTANMPQMMTETISKANAPQQQQQPQQVPRPAQETKGDAMTDMVKLLEMLNKQMGELISHTSDVASLSSKQVRATKNLSGNRLAT